MTSQKHDPEFTEEMPEIENPEWGARANEQNGDIDDTGDLENPEMADGPDAQSGDIEEIAEPEKGELTDELEQPSRDMDEITEDYRPGVTGNAQGPPEDISRSWHDPEFEQNSVDFEEEEEVSPARLSEVWRRRAHNLAAKPPPPPTGEVVDLLVFRLGTERYGIEVGYVREIYPLEQLTPVPRTPDFVAGVVSARGRIVSVIDLCPFFGRPSLKLSEQTKIIVVSNIDQISDSHQVAKKVIEVGILADEMADVTRIFKKDIEPPLVNLSGMQAEHLQGITSNLLGVLDIEALLEDKRLIIEEDI